MSPYSALHTALSPINTRIQAEEKLLDRFSRSRRYPLKYLDEKEHRARFRILADQWKRDTEFSSSPAELAAHPAHRAIVDMGWTAVPLILEDLTEAGGLWFWALRELTGENPVPHRDRGKIDQMTAAWLEWGRARGIILPDGRGSRAFRKAG